jgi:hypothetical protein
MKEAAMKNCREPENVRAFDLRRIEEYKRKPLSIEIYCFYFCGNLGKNLGLN